MLTSLRTSAISLSLLMFPLLAASAEAPFGVKLLRPDCLAGWDCGQAPARWTIAEGRLSGSGESSPLLSAWTFGDFELRFQWSAGSGAAWKVSLPDVPSGKGLEIAFREGDGCGQIKDGRKTLAPGAKLDPLADAMHTAVICRSGAKLVVKADDRPLAEVKIKPRRRFGLGLGIEGGEAAITDLRVQEPPGEPIFNGTDLAGWWCPGDIKAWTVENDEIVLSKGGGNYLRTEKEFGNFTLSLEYKIKKGGNSGIGIRTPHDGWPSGDGMELQIWDRPQSEPINKHSTMAIYGNVEPLARADKSEEWNRVVIKADGWMISAWVNGELVQTTNTLHHPELKHRNLKGWIGLQDHGARTEVRNLRVLEAPEGTGLDAWLAPLPARGATAMVDRLMNPEWLSVADGTTSGVVAAKVEGESEGERVLAELTGPGALVRVARNNGEGRLRFYFDGEEKPRLECKPGDLWHAAPELSEDANPVLTCLTYQKSLKISLDGAKAAEYRLDYVTFPASLPVETFADAQSGFPRGWLSAVNYRHGQGDWGIHREYDPVPRIASEPKTVEPGKTETLVHADGAGIVHWLKLKADKRVLDTNDLWLEVTIDGESSPAVAAPARFLFPGLAGQGNYHNFVLVDRGGVTARLAMPFADGLTVAAKNAGGEPIAGVAVTISVEPATDQTRDDIIHRMRLRGVFQPAGEGQSELVRQEGSGRWVGLVYQEPGGEPTGIESFTVDEQPAAGWPAATLDPLLGQGGNFRKCLSGRKDGLEWCYLFLAPVEFQKSLVLKSSAPKLGDRLALFYLKK